jgi:hypothetical protein
VKFGEEFFTDWADMKQKHSLTYQEEALTLSITVTLFAQDRLFPSLFYVLKKFSQLAFLLSPSCW